MGTEYKSIISYSGIFSLYLCPSRYDIACVESKTFRNSNYSIITPNKTQPFAARKSARIIRADLRNHNFTFVWQKLGRIQRNIRLFLNEFPILAAEFIGLYTEVEISL